MPKSIENMKVSEIASVLKIPEHKAKEVKMVVKGDINPQAYVTVNRWVQQCFHRPSDRELKMKALNEIVDGFGVEFAGDECGNFHGVDYVNKGDTYDNTIIYDHDKKKFTVGAWGNWVEHYMNHC